MRRVLPLVALIACSAATPARADVIEQVVAVVNDDAIWLSDLREAATPHLPRLFELQTDLERMAALRSLYEQLLERLIQEKLVEQAARRLQVRVTREEVDRAIRTVRQGMRLSEDQFWQAVAAQGSSRLQYESDVRRQLMIRRVLNLRTRGRINVTEEDVRREYDQRVARANRRLRFRASHIHFEIPAGAGATEVAAVRDRAEAVRAELTAETFAQQMAVHGGNDLGWLDQGDLPPELEAALMPLSARQLSGVVRGPSGYHIFVLHERERGGDSLSSYEEMREEIFSEMLEAAGQRAIGQLLAELEREAIISRRMQ